MYPFICLFPVQLDSLCAFIVVGRVMSSGVTGAPFETPKGSMASWERTDKAVAALEALDIVAMASHIVTQARAKGAKEAYNEAGAVRYQLAQIRQHVNYLQRTICALDLEKQEEQIKALTRANAKKRLLTEDI